MALETVVLAVGPGDADRIDRLAEETIDIAGPSGATVVLGHVFTDEEYDEVLDRLGFDPDSEEATPDEVAQRHATVRELVGGLDAVDVDYEIRGAVGEHARSIVDMATRAGANRIIVSGRSRRPTGKAVFGSTAQEVLLTAPCPVTFVRVDG